MFPFSFFQAGTGTEYVKKLIQYVVTLQEEGKCGSNTVIFLYRKFLKIRYIDIWSINILRRVINMVKSIKKNALAKLEQKLSSLLISDFYFFFYHALFKGCFSFSEFLLKRQHNDVLNLQICFKWVFYTWSWYAFSLVTFVFTFALVTCVSLVFFSRCSCILCKSIVPCVL